MISRILFTQPQYILQSVERHLHDLGVHDGQKIAQRADATLIYQISNLIGGATARRVRDGPSRLFSGLKFCFAQYFDENLGIG